MTLLQTAFFSNIESASPMVERRREDDATTAQARAGRPSNAAK